MLRALRKNAIKMIHKNDEIFFRLKLLNMSLAKLKTKLIDDETYIKRQYRLRTGKSLHLNPPVYFNEKIQWLKLHYRNPLLKKLVDKYEVRAFVKDRIGASYLIPIYGVYDTVDDIDFSMLPDKFVLKLTNGSGFNYICHCKTEDAIKEIRRRFRKWIKIDFYALGREWAYKDMKNRIICEKYLEDDTETELKDFKIFCFNGKPKLISVDMNRFSNHRRNLYAPNWEYIDAEYECPADPLVTIKKPEKLEEMLDCAKHLSKDFPHVRVDFYYLNNIIYFGELTFYHGAGYLQFRPKEFEKQLGNYLDISLIGNQLAGGKQR